MIEINYNPVSEIVAVKGIEKNNRDLRISGYYIKSVRHIWCGIQYVDILKNILIGNGRNFLSKFDYKKILDIIKTYFILTNQEYKIDISPKRVRLNESGL